MLTLNLIHSYVLYTKIFKINRKLKIAHSKIEMDNQINLAQGLIVDNHDTSDR